MTQDDLYLATQAMKEYGGSFVQALAECFFHADPNNTQKLLKAFPEYIEQYLQVAKSRYES